MIRANRLEITNGFQKSSVKLTFFREGQLERGTAQPQPTLPGNLARPGQSSAGTNGLVGRSRGQQQPVLRNKRSHRNEKPVHGTEEQPPRKPVRSNEDPTQPKNK
ncbi:hypothetical protein J1605_013856 [Eschrichtius robustus]|uniref:Uncharacterized protein n=1 Tax=Eschrichtius robustus TaxID=9764 RepID=A0AB34GHZ7_ESCRO|nr:hypothetical protein J1605_013856 [Eschrichtius robustus]